MRKKICAALLASILILVSSCTTKPQQPTNSGAIAPTNTSINTIATSSTTISSSTSSLPTATIKPSTTIKNFSLEEGFSKLKSIRYATINEKTSAKKDNNTLVATRTTNVDLDNNYYYADISSSNNKGSLQYADNSFYYKLSNASSVECYTETNDIFRTIGISNLLDSNLNYKKRTDGTYQLSVLNEVSNYNSIFDNINYDFGTNYVYNPSYLKLYLDIDNNEISKITIDASYIFGSFYSEIKREITISYEEFEKKPFDLSSGNKYYTNVGDTLETYVQEMVYKYGDSIYIKSGDFDMLIDAGQTNDGENVNRLLQEKCTDHKLEVLIGTHGHQDHLGGFTTGALDSITSVGLIIDYGYTGGAADYGYERYRDYFKDCDYYSAYDCVNLTNGASKIYNFSSDLSLEVLNTGAYQAKDTQLHSGCEDENEHSVVVKLTYKEHSYLYTGDISGNYESYLKQEDIQNMTVYKAAHHGSQTHNSNSQSFMNYVNPEIAVVSAAIVNSDNILDSDQAHPSSGFVRRILNTSKIKLSRNLYYNGTMGTIHLVDDGVNSIDVTGLGATKGYSIKGTKVTGEENKKFVETQFYTRKY